MKRWLFVIFAAALLVALAFFSKKETKDIKAPKNYSDVTNFEQCQNRGLPIDVSYPRSCRTPDGRIFVEIIKENNR